MFLWYPGIKVEERDLDVGCDEDTYLGSEDEFSGSEDEDEYQCSGSEDEDSGSEDEVSGSENNEDVAVPSRAPSPLSLVLKIEEHDLGDGSDGGDNSGPRGGRTVT